MKDYIDGYKVKKKQNLFFFIIVFIKKISFIGECRLLTGESPEISTLVSEALEGLKERQVLFK
jgi:hypothetical protein